MKAERLKGNEYLKAKMHLWGGSGYVFLNHMYYSLFRMHIFPREEVSNFLRGTLSAGNL